MPYSWDDQHDFDAGVTKGYSYHDARKSYDDVAVAKTSGRVIYTYKNDFLQTEARYPILIGIDTTGSMEQWPRIFFDKLPLLYKEAVKYFPDCAISFQAINDYHADGADVALQPAPFGQGPQLDELIGQLYPVGGGGGQAKESYEMFALYNAFLKAPKAIIKPIAIILGDEAPWEEVPPDVSRFYKIPESVPAEEAFRRLHQTCDVFLIRKPYYGFGEADQPMIDIWKKTAQMPEERILNINDPKRVVDVILGVLGILTGKTELFESELVERQNPDQVNEVLKSLHSLKVSYHQRTQVSQHSVTLTTKGTGKTRILDQDS